MPIKQQFPIYEFSKKFDYIQNKNGIWVSGGYVLNQKRLLSARIIKMVILMKSLMKFVKPLLEVYSRFLMLIQQTL